MTVREEDEGEGQPPKQEATCARCSTTFEVRLIRSSDDPFSVVYEGQCAACGVYALLTYVAERPN